MPNLLIVESPAKAKTIQPMLGSGWLVLASFGHVRDMPVNPPEGSIGVDPVTLRPSYEATDRGKGVIANIGAKARMCDAVYLATDPDREGEAIAWHIADSLRMPLDGVRRVTYNEISEKAIRAAIAKPRRLNMALVRAQEARRVLDRIVGYTVSPVLCKQAHMRLSAGRVQTPAVRIIDERERAIRDFVSVAHFGAELEFVQPAEFTARWDTKPFVSEDHPYVLDRALAQAAASVNEVKVTDVKDSTKTVNPFPPFTTSTMQQAASAKLGFSPDTTMKLAQSLFEVHHAITYHRTDSVTLSEEALGEIRKYAKKQGYPIPASPNRYQTKSKNAQEAHEAIRPVDVFRDDPEGLSPDEAKLYALIHLRAVASQLNPCKLALRAVELQSTQPSDLAVKAGAKDGLFRYIAKGQTVSDAGWTMLGGSPKETRVPQIPVGTRLRPESGEVLDQQTEPPKRYTEATLIAELEKRGIGRPATWAAIIKNIVERGYIAVDPKRKTLSSTALGSALIDSLRDMRFAAYDYTGDLEEKLDAISRGEADYKGVVGPGWSDLKQDMTCRMHVIQVQAGSFVPTGSRPSAGGSGRTVNGARRSDNGSGSGARKSGAARKTSSRSRTRK